MTELIQRKNGLLQKMDRAKAAGDSSETVRLSLEAAAAEEEIAEEYIAVRRLDDAAVNLVSRASCLLDAKQPALAVDALQRARNLTRNADALRWINTELDRILQEDGTGETIVGWMRRHVTAISARAESVVETRKCRYPHRFWSLPTEREILHYPDIAAEIVCSHCEQVVSPEEQKGRGSNNLVCRSCGTRL